MKKLFALVLAVAMLLSCAVVAEEAASDYPYGEYYKYDETVTITTVKRSDTNPVWLEGDSLDNNIETRYILEKLNVVTKTNWEVESSEFNEKLMLDVVADTLPDMWTLDNADYLIYRQLLENDMLCDMTDAYYNCRNWYVKDTADSFNNVHLDEYTENGRLMGIPTGRYGYEHNQLWLRTDVLEAIGMTADDVQTIEDIETYLTKGMEAFPDSCGLALNATDPLTNYGTSFSADQIAMAFGATPKYWVEQEDGTVVYGSTQSGMKEALRVLNDWYEKGLIDKEFATRTGNGLTQALTTSGEAIAWWAPWWYGWSIVDLLTNVPGANVCVANAPVNADGDYVCPWPAPAGTTLLVSKKCEHPEACVNILNVVFDMRRGFDQEANAISQDATEKGQSVGWGYIDPTGYVNLEYSGVVPIFGHAIEAFIESGDVSGFTQPSELTAAENCKRYLEGTYDVAAGEYISRVVAATKTDAENVKFVYPAFSRVTESAETYKTSLDTLEQQMVLQIIMGEKEVDYFDEFVTQWYAEGGQILTDEVNAIVNG